MSCGGFFGLGPCDDEKETENAVDSTLTRNLTDMTTKCQNANDQVINITGAGHSTCLVKGSTISLDATVTAKCVSDETAQASIKKQFAANVSNTAKISKQNLAFTAEGSDVHETTNLSSLTDQANIAKLFTDCINNPTQEANIRCTGSSNVSVLDDTLRFATKDTATCASKLVADNSIVQAFSAHISDKAVEIEKNTIAGIIGALEKGLIIIVVVLAVIGAPLAFLYLRHKGAGAPTAKKGASARAAQVGTVALEQRAQAMLQSGAIKRHPPQ